VPERGKRLMDDRCAALRRAEVGLQKRMRIGGARAFAVSDDRQKPMPTRAPAAAKAIAIALPIPELAPVTTVRRPVSGSSPVCAINCFPR
jgi:hypothetical protein